VIEALAQFDKDLFLFLNGFHATWANPLMTFASGVTLWIPLIFFSLWRARSQLKNKNLMLFILFLILTIIASDVTSSYIIKNLVNRMRPCRLDDLLPLTYQFGQKCGGKFGFVSSHAANSIALVFYSISALNIKNRFIYFIWILPLVVSFSRIYLGVHYPGDIIGGAMVGLFWGMVFSWAFRKSTKFD